MAGVASSNRTVSEEDWFASETKRARQHARSEPEISVVIPVLNERDNVRQLCEEIIATLEPIMPFEIIFVDDGSTDDTSDVIRKCMATGEVRMISHSRRAGQSAALRTGVSAARADWIATLDGDCQNDPADLAKLWEVIRSSDAPPVLVIGNREKRRDNFVKRASSTIANAVRRSILADGCADTGCGIKIFHRAGFMKMPWFDHVHRFMPALFRANGYRYVSVPVSHRPRTRGSSKYGVFDRLWVGIVDLAGVFWLRKRMVANLEIREEDRD